MDVLYPSLHDNWGHKTTYLTPKPRHSVGWTDHVNDTFPKVEQGGTYWVRWPNGEWEQVEIEMRRYATTVSDMGQRYDVAGYEPYLIVKHKGAKISLRLTDAGVAMRADEWRI